MTIRKKDAVRRQHREPWETGQILDHFVTGFEWTIPTRIKFFDFKFLENFPGEFDGDRMLVYSVSPPLGRVHAGPGLLEDFLKLGSAPDEAILAFAGRWGPLWQCPAHGLPWQHDSGCEPSMSDWEIDDDGERQLSDEDYDRLSPEERAAGTSRTWHDESLSAWRDLSRQARATIRLARRLHDGRVGDQPDWDTLPFLHLPLARVVAPAVSDPFATFDDFPTSADLAKFRDGNRGSDSSVEVADALRESNSPPEPNSRKAYWDQLEALGRSRMAGSVEFQRQLFGEVLNYWLEIAGVRPRMDWSTAKPAVQLGGHGLIGALAVQILFDCSRTDGLAVCTSCGTPFLPGPRRPRRDRNTYCSDCGLKAASRDAAARYRQTPKYRSTYGKWREGRGQRKPSD